MELNEIWQAYVRRVEDKLTALYAGHREPQKQLFEAMNYSLLAGGKRLRPFLVYAFCELCGGSPVQADNAAMAIEMVHTYSLIHDDLPCMDDDDLRRGKPTNHKVYGEAQAVLAGDGLLTDAFYVLSTAKLPPQTVTELVKTLAYRAGPYGMVGGQVLDMAAGERACTRNEVLAIQRRKTGALIRAACEMGILCANGTPDQRNAAGAYADAVGLAFQIRDDILDAEGDASKLGKATGVDEDKNTFVRLYGLEYCKRKVKTLTRQACNALSAFDHPDRLVELAEYLSARDH